jgi:hypothetical protein
MASNAAWKSGEVAANSRSISSLECPAFAGLDSKSGYSLQSANSNCPGSKRRKFAVVSSKRVLL